MIQKMKNKQREYKEGIINYFEFINANFLHQSENMQEANNSKEEDTDKGVYEFLICMYE
jgi:hypothetical protein